MAQAQASGGRTGAPLRALVVDDEPSLVQVVGGYLARDGFEVVTAGDGEDAVALARTRNPDIIVLDLMLPGIDGIEACRQIRTFSDAYIIMLTARSDEVDKLVGLSVGADDYLTKPFSPRELVARVRVMLRRPRAGTGQSDGVRRIGALTVDPAGREARVDGRTVSLTRTEFDLLDVLSADPGVVLSRGTLFERVWGGDWHGDDHLVDVHVGNLRRKLGDDPAQPRFVRTVRGIGYRMGAG